MTTNRRRFLAIALLLPVAGAVSRARAQDSAAAAAPAPRPSADLITREQVDVASQRSAWEIVQSVRGNWLRPRPGSRSGPSLTRPAPGDSAAASRGGMPTPGERNSEVAPIGGTAGVQVYLDGMKLGDLQQLRTIPSNVVYWIRRYSGSEAQMRFGPGHSDGVLFVSTRP